MRFIKNSKKIALSDEITADIDLRLTELMEEITDKYPNEPIHGEFFICLLDLAQDIKASLKDSNIKLIDDGFLIQSLIEDESYFNEPELTDEEKKNLN